MHETLKSGTRRQLKNSKPVPVRQVLPFLQIFPSFSANRPYRTLSFFSFRFHYMDFPDCLLLLLAYPSFYFFCFYTFLVVGFRAVD